MPELSEAEMSYRRGVSQALSLATNLVRNPNDKRELARLTDESMRLRYDGKPHLAYLDELMKRKKISYF